jgi:hypothetical protein
MADSYRVHYSIRGSGRDIMVQAESAPQARRTVMEMFPGAVVTGVHRIRSCQRPICLMRLLLSAASCSGVILENCESPSWSLPWWNCQVTMSFIYLF